MAQIKINSKVVIEACEKALPKLKQAKEDACKNTNNVNYSQWAKDRLYNIECVKELAEYSIKNPETEPIDTNYVSVKPPIIWIDHNDYQLLKEYL